ncbi:MAG: 4-hydroxythreonine-4-phosphate dehydrogenase PdxA [Pirellula sp.]
MTHAGIKPKIGITMGDPTGIGPEILVGALASGELEDECHPIAIGRSNVLRAAASAMRVVVNIKSLETCDEAIAASLQHKGGDVPTLYCIEAGRAEADLAVEPRIDARGGQAAYDCLIAGTQFCLDGKLDAIVTAPLHKKALQLAGHDWPGHTELLAHLCGTHESAMMLYLPPRNLGPVNDKVLVNNLGADRQSEPIMNTNRGGPAGLGVVHVTLHMALRDVFANLTVTAIAEKIDLAHAYFSRLRKAMHLVDEHGSSHPRIAVAALNPHGGEHGRFGDEESRIIEPAVRLARERGIRVEGPLPVDTLMPKAVRGEYDAVVAMYHDQGHIALKLLDMYEAVNITLGLPIIRTSVAHGTAHDIAWQGIAKPGGMTQAILAAARLARSRV